MRTPLLLMALCGVGIASATPGCGDENSIVDGDCAVGYTACGNQCVDTMSDPTNCGECSTRCLSGVACVGAACGGSLDGSLDGPRDGSLDGHDENIDDSEETGADVQGDGSNQEGGSCPPPPYVTAAACGACGVVCVAPNAACLLDAMGNRVCAPPCVVPLVECNGRCVDFTKDPKNCGACGKVCPSNVCMTSMCQGATPGDVVVIGHDYQDAVAGSSQTRVLANAVFTPATNPLRILSYEQFADAAVVANVKALIQSAAAGRTIAISVATTPAPLASSTLSQTYDVVLIHDQPGGAPGILAGVGATWVTGLATFAKAGGVIVALDGAGGKGGMPKLLTSAQLLDVASHQSIAAGSLVSIVAPADRIATLVISPYGAFDRSVTLQSNEPNGGNVVYVAEQVVGGVLGDPVVVHKIVP